VDPRCEDGMAAHDRSAPLSVSGLALDTSPPVPGGEDGRAAALLSSPSRSGGEVSARSADGEGANFAICLGPRGRSRDTATTIPRAATMTSCRAAASAGRNRRSTARRRWCGRTKVGPTSPARGGRREASGGGGAPKRTPTRRSDDRRPPHKGEVRAARSPAIATSMARTRFSASRFFSIAAF
jgi:hypothetical protein